MTTRPRPVGHPIASFGRRAPAPAARVGQSSTSGLADDLRLFALTFAAGFLFMSVYLA